MSYYNYIFVAIYYFAKCFIQLIKKHIFYVFLRRSIRKYYKSFLLDTVSFNQTVSEGFVSKFSSLFVIQSSLIKTILPPPLLMYPSILKLWICQKSLTHWTINYQLGTYGFYTKALYYIKNYLDNRKQRVRMNSNFSIWQEIIAGVSLKITWL